MDRQPTAWMNVVVFSLDKSINAVAS